MKFLIELCENVPGNNIRLTVLAQAGSLDHACAIAHLLATRHHGQPVQIWLRTKGKHLTASCCDSEGRLKTELDWKQSAERTLIKLREKQRLDKARRRWMQAHAGCWDRIQPEEHLRSLLFANRFTELEAALAPQPQNALPENSCNSCL